MEEICSALRVRIQRDERTSTQDQLVAVSQVMPATTGLRGGDTSKMFGSLTV